jgi:predicted flap endonuclease-1-like 5' DNA nuclease
MWSKSKTDTCGMRWWNWILIIVGPPIAALLLWLWLRRRTAEEAPSAVRIEISSRARRTAKEMPAAGPTPPTPDDLSRIEGIGPRISKLFQAVGITTFAQLATTEMNRLKETLREAGIRANPDTWPEQAILAAAGDWDALEALQAELTGGRRV